MMEIHVAIDWWVLFLVLPPAMLIGAFFGGLGSAAAQDLRGKRS